MISFSREEADARVTPFESNDANAGTSANNYTTPSQEQPLQASAPEAKPSPAIEEAIDNKDPIEITEKKPLEARDTKASEGDNLSGEEVDKW